MPAIASSSTAIARTALTRPFIRYASTYTPESANNFNTPPRPPRPEDPTFFTGRPAETSTMNELSELLLESQQALRKSHIFPLPSRLIPPQPPQVRWKSPIEMADIFGRNLKNNTHRRVTDLLNELNRLRYIAELGSRGDVAESIQSVIEDFLKSDDLEGDSGVSGKKAREGIDKFGRALGLGKRKTASASVWIIPTKTAAGLFEETTSIHTQEGEGELSKTPFVAGEVLINHVPLSTYFRRPIDREIVLRPLRIAGYLGAFNVFAKVQGGGPSGQSGAVAVGLARALLVMRGEEVKDVLMASSSLRRDPRMKERKKTNLLGARKARAWVKR